MLPIVNLLTHHIRLHIRGTVELFDQRFVTVNYDRHWAAAAAEVAVVCFGSNLFDML